MGAFTGAAEHYERYRERYPEALFADLLQRVVGRTMAVDLACGTGQLAIPLARHFGAVLAVDVEPDMIDVGRSAAISSGVTNVDWRLGRAEEIALEADSVDLVTIGNAFHRLDREPLAARVADWLRPGGPLVVAS